MLIEGIPDLYLVGGVVIAYLLFFRKKTIETAEKTETSTVKEAIQQPTTQETNDSSQKNPTTIGNLGINPIHQKFIIKEIKSGSAIDEIARKSNWSEKYVEKCVYKLREHKLI